ncbi:MAG: hypothetical protein ACRC7O_03070, partial [Fimbriiglobus sp.]
SADELKLLTTRIAADGRGAGRGVMVVAGAPALIGYADVYIGPARQLQQVLLSEADFYFHRGLLALYQGDIPEATSRFQQALAPQGVDLTALGNPGRAAEIRRYLGYIRQTAGAK